MDNVIYALNSNIRCIEMQANYLNENGVVS